MEHLAETLLVWIARVSIITSAFAYLYILIQAGRYRPMWAILNFFIPIYFYYNLFTGKFSVYGKIVRIAQIVLSVGLVILIVIVVFFPIPRRTIWE